MTTSTLKTPPGTILRALVYEKAGVMLKRTIITQTQMTCVILRIFDSPLLYIILGIIRCVNFVEKDVLVSNLFSTFGSTVLDINCVDK